MSACPCVTYSYIYTDMGCACAFSSKCVHWWYVSLGTCGVLMYYTPAHVCWCVTLQHMWVLMCYNLAHVCWCVTLQHMCVLMCYHPACVLMSFDMFVCWCVILQNEYVLMCYPLACVCIQICYSPAHTCSDISVLPYSVTIQQSRLC